MTVILTLFVVEVVLAFAVMAAILLQTGYSAGISGAFGGGSQQAYGGKKRGVDELLERISLVVAILFAINTLLLARLWH